MQRRSPAIARLTSVLLALCGVVAGCGRPDRRGPADSGGGVTQRPTGPLQVMNAAAATQPIRAVLDSFSARTGILYEQEPGASLEVARRITETGRRPDVVVLADPQVFPSLLMPQFTTWYALFGRNRIVLAYTPRSRGAGEISPGNWREVILRPGVEIGRADPNTDPSGYRTLLVFELAERHYREPGLAKRLLDAAPIRNVRPREADQVALLDTHELDYIWTYENLAQNNKLPYVKLPDAVDLGNPADSATYASVTTRVLGKRAGDTLTIRGSPILFAVSVLGTAGHRDAAEQFVRFLVSPDGRRILEATHFDVLAAPIVVGDSAPALSAKD